MCEQCEIEESLPPVGEIADQPIIFFEPFEIITENLAESDIRYDEKEFQQGLKDSSYIAGMYSGLLNCGMSMDDAIAYVFNHMTIKANLEISKIQANANIESAKNARISIESQQL